MSSISIERGKLKHDKLKAIAKVNSKHKTMFPYWSAFNRSITTANFMFFVPLKRKKNDVVMICGMPRFWLMRLFTICLYLFVYCFFASSVVLACIDTFIDNKHQQKNPNSIELYPMTNSQSSLKCVKRQLLHIYI